MNQTTMSCQPVRNFVCWRGPNLRECDRECGALGPWAMITLVGIKSNRRCR